MDGSFPLRPAVPIKEARLAALLSETGLTEADLLPQVRAAQIAGSLALSGLAAEAEVEAGLRGEPVPVPVRAALEAHRAFPPEATLSLDLLLGWQGAFTSGRGALRQGERRRADAPPPAPPESIGSRLQVLLDWLAAPSARELTPSGRGALALARLIEIAPFEDANGRVARLAASHLMVQGGARPPILLGSDAPRLQAALQAAFRLDTAPLVRLLEEASERALDAMLAAARAATSRPGGQREGG